MLLPVMLLLPPQDYTEDYIQTGSGRLYALSTRMFSLNRESIPYTWNHTITYDSSQGTMPYLVETLRATAVRAVYRPLEEMLEYSIQASILKGGKIQLLKELNEQYPPSQLTFGLLGPEMSMRCWFVTVAGDRSNQCPRGFSLVPAGPYCAGTLGIALVAYICMPTYVLLHRVLQMRTSVRSVTRALTPATTPWAPTTARAHEASPSQRTAGLARVDVRPAR